MPDGWRLTRNDLLAALLVVTGIVGLFILDISEPRGVVDGVGYAAVVALTVRFGRRALIAAAAVTTFLTVIAAGLLPDSGISVAGMWANRGCAIASIWIIAFLLLRRLKLEAELEIRDRHTSRHQEALAQMVRVGLLLEESFDQRLLKVCRIGVEALEVEGGAFFLRNSDNKTVTVLQAWRRDPDKPFFRVGDFMNEDPEHKLRLMRDLVIATDDMELAESYPGLRPVLRQLGIRATLAAEAFHGSPSSATVGFGHDQPHRWTRQDAAFAQAAASLVATLISVQRNSETLAALDLAGDGLYTEDAKGNIGYSNLAARHFARQTPEGPLYPRPRGPLSGERDRHEITFEGRELEIHRARLPGGGAIARIADVTERNRLEARLHQAAKMEAIGQLASGVSHDFNNILAAIAGFGGFIAQDRNASPDNRAFAQRILNACDRAKELVEQIVTFADTRTVARGKVNLARVMKRCEELFSSGLQPGALLEVDLPKQPLWISANEVQIGRLLANLVVNARDALDGGGGGIEVSAVIAPQSEIESLGASQPRKLIFGVLDPRQGYARLRVSDTGCGIAPAVMQRMFEPFFTTKGRQRGTGLGLAVVHGVIAAHGGACHLRSEPGKGTTFSIYLPVAEEGPAVRAKLRPGDAPCRVLIVDDEVDMTELLSIGLERLGFDTVAVQDPREALAAVEEDPSAFDAVLTDHDMPVMPGLELIGRLRAIAPRLRIVLCTGHRDIGEEAALDSGADAFLRKPVAIEAAARALAGPVSACAK